MTGEGRVQPPQLDSFDTRGRWDSSLLLGGVEILAPDQVVPPWLGEAGVCHLLLPTDTIWEWPSYCWAIANTLILH